MDKSSHFTEGVSCRHWSSCKVEMRTLHEYVKKAQKRRRGASAGLYSALLWSACIGSPIPQACTWCTPLLDHNEWYTPWIGSQQMLLTLPWWPCNLVNTLGTCKAACKLVILNGKAVVCQPESGKVKRVNTDCIHSVFTMIYSCRVFRFLLTSF